MIDEHLANAKNLLSRLIWGIIGLEEAREEDDATVPVRPVTSASRIQIWRRLGWECPGPHLSKG